MAADQGYGFASRLESTHQVIYALMHEDDAHLDDDVAPKLEQLRRDRDESQKDIVNDALQLSAGTIRSIEPVVVFMKKSVGV